MFVECLMTTAKYKLILLAIFPKKSAINYVIKYKKSTNRRCTMFHNYTRLFAVFHHKYSSHCLSPGLNDYLIEANNPSMTFS